jgi:hypothetical protein
VVAVQIALVCHGEERSDVAIHFGSGRVSFAKGVDVWGGGGRVRSGLPRRFAPRSDGWEGRIEGMELARR